LYFSTAARIEKADPKRMRKVKVGLKLNEAFPKESISSDYNKFSLMSDDDDPLQDYMNSKRNSGV